MFEAIGSHEEVYAPQLQRTCYVRSDPFCLPGEAGEVAMAQEAIDHSNAVDEVPCSTASTTFSTLHTLMENSQLYAFRNEVLND